MPQTRLDAFWVSLSGPKATAARPLFLDLPPELRRRIYIDTGLVRFCPIVMNPRQDDLAADLTLNSWSGSRSRGPCYYPNKRFHSRFTDDYDLIADCACPPLPLALLYVSRAIGQESSAIFYAENSFSICRSQQQGLSPLYRLSDSKLALLTTLSIRLNACPCFPGHLHNGKDRLRDCNCHQTCRDAVFSREKPLDMISRNDKSVLSEWKSICGRLARNIHPSRLKLSVICDTANYQVALEVVEPLLKLPRLLDCSLRLGQRPNYRLGHLAKTTVLQATKSFEREEPTHSNRLLPVEILRHILAQADLVAPFAQQWRPGKGFVKLECCRLCTDCLEVCCCAAQHAAFARRCVCWIWPVALLLTNRSIHDEVTRILYRENHFIALPEKPNDSVFTPLDTPPSLLRFLMSLPSNAWPHLRSVECDFPAFKEHYFHVGSAEHTHWVQAIDFMLCNLAATASVTLIINLESQRGDCADHAYLSQREINRQEDSMWAVYQRIVEPVKRLTSLANLFIHLSWPKDVGKLETRNRHEVELERRVMGPGYDSVACGKFKAGMPWTRW